MKEKRDDVLLFTCETMAAVTPPPTVLSHHRQSFPTPSPFSFSVTSTTRSSIFFFNGWSLVLHSLSLVLSFVSALSLAAPSANNTAQQPSSFTTYPELVYCFIVGILAFLFSAFQLFKGVCDIAHRGVLISDKTFDYISFILDQLVGYLLISSSSTAISFIQHNQQDPTLRKAAIIAAAMSFAAFLVIVICGLLSGYKLCTRTMW